MAEPVFYVLKRRLAASETPYMLGRFVKHFQDPTSSYLPEQPSSHIPDLPASILTTCDVNIALRVNSTKDSSLKAMLQGLLSFGTSHTGEQESQLESPRIITRRFKNIPKIFAALKADPDVRTQLLEMLPVGERLYLVVGIMTLCVGTFQHSGKTSKGVHGGITVPMGSAAASATTSGLLPLIFNGGVGNIDLGAKNSSSSGWMVSGRIEDHEEEVFAVEYRIVERAWAGLGKNVVYRDKVPDYKGGQTYGEDSEGEDEDEDEAVAINGVEVLEELLLPGSAGGLRTVLDRDSGLLFDREHNIPPL